MPLRNKIHFILIATAYFVAVFFALNATANAQEATDTVVAQEVVIGPGQHDTPARRLTDERGTSA